MKRASIVLLAVFAFGCGRKVVVHPDKLATKGDPGWRITSEPGASGGPAPATTAPLPPTTPQGTPNAPPAAGTPNTPPPPIASPRR